MTDWTYGSELTVAVLCEDCCHEITGQVKPSGEPEIHLIDCPHCPPAKVWNDENGRLRSTKPYGVYVEGNYAL